MIFNLEGITTGLLGYSLRKEFFSDAIPYREVETFNFEIYSSDLSGLSPYNIQSGIYSQFANQYSGNIDVKVFSVPGAYQFPDDSIRTAKYNVQVEVRDTASGLSNYSELNGNYYKGLDSTFFTQYGYLITNFKEEFTFDQSNNGHQSFNHTIGFGLMSGGKPTAVQIASGIFSNDYNTTMGISVMIGGITGGNPANVQEYYSEGYDLIKNTYSFSKKRDFYPFDASSFNYNLIHSMTLKENGVFDITEKCDLQAKISFLQATQGLNLVYNGAWTRCNTFYNLYSSFIAQPGEPASIATISTTPRKLVQTFNNPTLFASYEVILTNDPQFQNAGDSIEEIIELDVNQQNIVTINDKYTFTFNKRNPTFQGAYTLITGAYVSSPTVAYNYYTGSNFYRANWPLNMTKFETLWPYNKHQSNINITYSNDPRNNVTINGVFFNTLDYNVENNQPTDIITEYKIINRPNKLSVLNFPYQSSIGMIKVSFNAGIGRQTNEFINGFRSDISKYLNALYTYGINLFMQQFNNVIPTAFTYYLDDIKYTLNNNGSLAMSIDFKYAIKRYIA